MQGRSWRVIGGALVVGSMVHCVGFGEDTAPDPGTGDDASTPDTGGGGDAPGDTSSDTGVDAGFCAKPGAAFCEDFDDKPLAAAGWEQTTTNGSQVALAASDRSMPYALQASTPAQTRTGPFTEAFVSHVLGIPDTFTVIDIAFDMRVSQRDMRGDPKDAFRVMVGTQAFTVTSNSATELYLLSADKGVATHTPDIVTSPFDAWMHVTVRIERTPLRLEVSATLDGASITTKPLQAELPAPGVQWKLYVGAFNQSNNGATRILHDNIVVTTK